MTRIGIVVSPDTLAAADTAEPDYLEPAISGALVERAPDGTARIADPFRDRRYLSFAVLFPGDLALSDPRRALDPVWEYLDATLPLVASVAEPGATVVFGSGTARTIPDGVDRSAAEARFAAAVVGTRDRAAEWDLRIALEPLSRDETNLLHTIAEAAAFLDTHGIDGVGINADLFHMGSASEPVSVAVEHADRIRHVHIADTGRRAIGLGDAPWRELLDGLLGAGYPGNVSLECRWGEDAAAEMREAVQLVRTELARNPTQAG